MNPAEVAELEPNEVVKHYDDFVHSIAFDLAKKLKIRVEPDDLVAYGFQGLLEAHERFDPTAGNRFSSYAYYRVRGAILDGCRKEGWQTRSRARTEERTNELMESTHAVQQNVAPARSFSESSSRVTDMVSDATTVLLLDRMEDIDHEVMLSPASQEGKLEEKDTQRLLKEGIRLLTEQEREVVMRFYFKDERMQDIGEDFGHSRSWVSRIHTRAIERIRRHFDSEQS